MTTPDVIFPNLGIELEKVSRKLPFEPFGIEIYWYGVILCLGIAVAYIYARHAFKKEGLNPAALTDFMFYGLIFGILGARIYYVIFSWDRYKGDLLQILNIRNGGLAIYGVVIACVITAIIFTRRRKISFFRFIDCCMPALLIGQIIGRFGNFVNREAFGDYSDGLLAMRYKLDEVNFGNLTKAVLDNLKTYGDAQTLYVQVQPAFLYEGLWNLGILAVMLIYKKFARKVRGELFALYFIGYGIGRFWIEGFRSDSLILWGTGLPVSQLLSAALVAFGAALLIWLRLKKPGAEPETETSETEGTAPETEETGETGETETEEAGLQTPETEEKEDDTAEE